MVLPIFQLKFKVEMCLTIVVANADEFVTHNSSTYFLSYPEIHMTIYVRVFALIIYLARFNWITAFFKTYTYRTKPIPI